MNYMDGQSKEREKKKKIIINWYLCYRYLAFSTANNNDNNIHNTNVIQGALSMKNPRIYKEFG